MLCEISFQNLKVRYRTEGRGKNCIVLLHGFCESLEIWNDFTSRFIGTKKFRVIVPDLLGHGKSECPTEISSMEMMAQSVNEILMKEKIKKCVLIGHSMGGYVSLAFAELFPEKVKGLCLFHSSSLADSEEKKADRNRAIEVVKNDHLAFVSGLIPKLFAPANLENMKKQVERAMNIAKKIPKEGIISALAGMRDRKDRQHILENANFPVQFIMGKEDALISVEKMLPQFVKPKHAEALLLNGVGHMGFYEAKKKTLIAVEGFAINIFTAKAKRY